MKTTNQNNLGSRAERLIADNHSEAKHIGHAVEIHKEETFFAVEYSTTEDNEVKKIEISITPATGKTLQDIMREYCEMKIKKQTSKN